jgi:hypothetical protein
MMEFLGVMPHFFALLAYFLTADNTYSNRVVKISLAFAGIS